MVGGPVMTLIAPTPQAFFTDRLAQQRQASPRTIAAYQATTPRVRARTDRKVTSPTRLGRPGRHHDHRIPQLPGNRPAEQHPDAETFALTAIRSLFAYAALLHPEHAMLIQRVLAIPPKRFDKRIVTFLTSTEVDALVAAPDQSHGRTTRSDTAVACRSDRSTCLRTHRPELR